MKKFLAGCVLKLCGWTPEGDAPTIKRFVLIAAPHTSNWDFVWLILMAVYFDVRISWVGKHTLFRWPFRGIMLRLGGVPIRRDIRQNFVQQMADALTSAEYMALVVPAEGTRGRAPRWKSGFYHIAKTAGVPILTGYLDYGRKAGGFGTPLALSGDIGRDMDNIRAFYQDIPGKSPKNYGPIILREEEEEQEQAEAAEG